MTAARTGLSVAVLQAQAEVGAVEVNLGTVAEQAWWATARGARILVLPELFVSGYAPERVATEDGAPHRERLAQIAAANKIWIAAATVEHASDGKYILATLTSPDGTHATSYRKRTLFGRAETRAFRPGDAPPDLVSIDGITTALSVCYDVEFPEVVRDLALRGAHLLLVPTAVPLRGDIGTSPHPLDTRRVPEILIPARAMESQLYIAYANHCGPGFAARSTLADPYGRTTTATPDVPALVIGRVEATLIEQARADTDYLARIRTRYENAS